MYCFIKNYHKQNEIYNISESRFDNCKKKQRSERACNKRLEKHIYIYSPPWKWTLIWWNAMLSFDASSKRLKMMRRVHNDSAKRTTKVPRNHWEILLFTILPTEFVCLARLHSFSDYRHIIWAVNKFAYCVRSQSGDKRHSSLVFDQLHLRNGNYIYYKFENFSTKQTLAST